VVQKINQPYQQMMSQFQWQQIGSMKLDPEATGSKKSPYSIRQQ
jgi:hypothetical protein